MPLPPDTAKPHALPESMGEFELIRRYFTRPVRQTEAIALGIGDDCALLQTAPGMQLAISSDMLVEGRHFFPGVDPAALGHKALAVNLSDLAACGARPLAFTLALALPRVDEAWLEGFASGLFALADAHGCELIGGDTTQGPLNICITVFGEMAQGRALLRSGAHPGDDIYVSGTLGEARLALDALRGRITLAEEVFAAARLRLERPAPRVALGQALRGIATSAIDISDGLAGDLSHILEASGVGARIQIEDAITLIADCARTMRATATFGSEIQLDYVFAGGDDYELVFTAPRDARRAVENASTQSRTAVSRIGRIEAQPGLRLIDAGGRELHKKFHSFDHFA